MFLIAGFERRGNFASMSVRVLGLWLLWASYSLSTVYGQESAGTAKQDATAEAVTAAGELKPTSPKSPMTIAERSNFLATSRGEEVEAFLSQLARTSPFAKLMEVGQTHENRSLWGLVVSKDLKVSLPLAADDPRLVILMIGGIHSGECDSKEALLALARDTVQGKHNDWLDRCVLVFLPNFNADGNERVGPMHRPGQEGPALGMGTRENALGQDLNRDFVKLDTQEVRSLVRLIDAFQVDVLFDAHTTNGSLHRYDMTYDIPHNPAVDRDMIGWLKSEMLPAVSQKMQALGSPIFPYGNFNRDHTVWESYGFEPRYSTEYMGLRGKIGILVESYSYATYQRRIEVSYSFIEESISYLCENFDAVRSLVRKPVSTSPKGVAIQGVIEPGEERAKVAGYRWPEKNTAEKTATEKTAPEKSTSEQQTKETKPQEVTFPSPKDRGRVKEMEETQYEVRLANVATRKLEVDAPIAYHIPKECSWLASRIRLHGVPMIEVSGEVKSVVEQYKITDRKELNEFQFRKLSKYSVALEEKEMVLGPGWIVPTDHPLGVLVTYILEPHSDESLAMWGFLDPMLQPGAVYPITRCKAMPSFPKVTPLEPLAWLDLKAKDIVGEKLTLDKLYSPKDKVAYSGAPTPLPRWMPHGEGYITRREQRWFHVDAATGAMHPWETPQRMVEALSKLPEFVDNAAAPYGRQIELFQDGLESAVINHKNDLYHYDLLTDAAQRVTNTPEQIEELVELSPTQRHVAYVHQQDLYVADCKTKEVKRLTDDGGGEILNGKLDWVTQEEVYGRGQFKAYWWNSDGTKIAYLRLDETPVPTFVIDDSLSFAQKVENMRYPKAGQPNPRVSLHVVDVQTGAKQEVPLSIEDPAERLVVRVGWKPGVPNALVYQIQNRIQNRLDVVLYDCATQASQVLVHEESKAWVDVIDSPRWLLDGSFIWVSDSGLDGQYVGRRHLYHVAIDGTKRALTRGDWDLKEISAITDGGKYVWMTAHRSAPTNTDVLRLALETGELESMSELTGAHRISVHPTGSYFIDSWSDLNHPPETWLRDREGKPIRLLSGYRSDRFDYVQTVAPELIRVSARDGEVLQGLLYKPERRDGDNTRHPVVMYVYAGPSAPTVENSWTHRSDLWHRYLTDRGIAVLLCDNRSALGKGNADTWKVYKNLGALELRDLEDTASWLSGQDWVDKDRIGIWGWSYGGYFTAYAMTHSKLFRAGISGAPVTDWRNYDSIYTERYMDTPQANPEGYQTSSVVEAAKNLHGRLLLIHGEIDENVHMSNTLQFVNALQEAGKQFELMVYPKNRHGIVDPEQMQHQYQMMTDFFIRNLGQ